MENKNEILLAIKEARRDLKEGISFRAEEMLSLVEGMAPFLDKQAIIKMKCMRCDNYAASFFPLEGDFYAVDKHEYCHAKKISLQNLSRLKIGSCMEYSDCWRKELDNLANSLVKEDLEPAFAQRKLYDRTNFASYKVNFEIHQDAGKICIEFGHKSGGDFIAANMKLHILRRLDPGFGPEALKKIAGAMKKEFVLVVEASQQTRRQLDIDYVLEWIAQKRKMDIIYL
jgi:hypothetical protein